MSCKNRSRAFATGLAEASADMRSHMEICADCRAAARRSASIDLWLRTASPRGLGEQLDEPAQGRLLSKITAQRARERKARKHPALSIACALALLTAIAGWIPNSADLVPRATTAAAAAPDVCTSKESAPLPDRLLANIAGDAVARAFPVAASCLPPVLATVSENVTPWSIAAALEGGPVPLDAVPLLARFVLEEEPPTAARALAALGRAGGAAAAAAVSKAFDRRPEIRTEALSSLRRLAEGGCEEARAAGEERARRTNDGLSLEERAACWRIGLGGAESPGLACVLEAALTRGDAAARTALSERASRLRPADWNRALEMCGRPLTNPAAEEALLRVAWESRAVGLVPWIRDRIAGPNARLALRALSRIGSAESLEIFVMLTCGPNGHELRDSSREAWADLDGDAGRAVARILRSMSSAEVAGRALGQLAHTRTLGARAALEALRNDARLAPAARFAIAFLEGQFSGRRAGRTGSQPDVRLESAIARLEGERHIEIGFVSSIISSQPTAARRLPEHSLGL